VTRKVADSALYLDVVADRAGADGSFLAAARTPPPALRIAISSKPARAALPPTLSDDVKRGLADAETALRGLGHDVQRHEPSYGMAGNNFVPRYLGGAREDVDAVPHRDGMAARTRGFGRLGRAYPASIIRRATRAAASDAEKINASWSEFEVLVTPTVGETAIEVGRWDGKGAFRTLMAVSRIFAFTPIWNHTGQPAAAIPAGFTDAGLPRSVTLIGRPGDEATLLSLAAQLEDAMPWADRRPPGF
jgi:amidase